MTTLDPTNDHQNNTAPCHNATGQIRPKAAAAWRHGNHMVYGPGPPERGESWPVHGVIRLKAL
eukprot:9734746-Karenia_brevis.AAC.1